MKFLLVLIAALLCLRPAHAATTIEWGSLRDSFIVDSNGNPLPESFSFQLGYFQTTFTPTVENVYEWADNWVLVNQAGYDQYTVFDEELGYFTSSFSYDSNELGLDLENKQAYIWVFNSQTPSVHTEWFLATATEWVFPAGVDDCCNNNPPNVQWSISDLDPVTPLWGAHLGNASLPGEFGGIYDDADPNAGTYDLQTFTFVPEPSSVLLLAMGACGLVLRRRRESRDSQSAR